MNFACTLLFSTFVFENEPCQSIRSVRHEPTLWRLELRFSYSLDL